MTYTSARGVHAHKVNESLNTLHTAEATTAQRSFASAVTDWPNSSSSTTQHDGGAAPEAASYERASLLSSV